MAYTRPQAAPAVANGSGTTISKPFTSNVTAHSVLIACATTDVNTTFTFSSTGSPTWAKVGAPFFASGATQYIAIGYCLDAPSGATTVTCTFGTGGSFQGLIIGEYAAPGGVASVLDGSTAGTNQSSSTSHTDTAVGSANDLIISYIISANSGVTITAGSGFTIIQNDTSDIAAADDKLSAAGATGGAFTFSPTSAAGILTAAFAPSGGAAALPPDLIMAPRALQYGY